MISTHVLDTTVGLPAAGVRVALERRVGDAWTALGSATTDADGRIRELLSPGAALERGVYRLHFETGAYFGARGVKAFHPAVAVEFEVTDPSQRHHVPLLVTPFSHSTYRGS
ncbi:MAG: hydroxyisourate hydrolase [Gemmatimonadaceae bacterium]